MIHANIFRELRIPQPLGVLLYGPPGTGKTLLARILSQRQGRHFLPIRLSTVVKGDVGAGEYALWEAFTTAKRCAPSVIFIDEFQAAFSDRGDSGDTIRRDGTGALLTAALAACMDDLQNWNDHAGPGSSVLLLCATNEPWAVDTGFLRPGRLDLTVYVGALDAEARMAMLADGIEARRGCATGDEVAEIEVEARASVEDLTEGFTGADLSLLLQKAALSLVRIVDMTHLGTVELPRLQWSHLEAILRSGGVARSVSVSHVSRFQKWGSSGGRIL